MPLIITSVSPDPLDLFSDGTQLGTELMLNVAGLVIGIHGSQSVTWELTNAATKSVQAVAPEPLSVDASGNFTVPTVATEDGPLTLTFAEVGDSTNTGTFGPLDSRVFSRIAVTSTPTAATLGQPVTFVADIEDSNGRADGVILNWSSSSSVIPAGATPKTTIKGDLSTFKLTTTNVSESDLTDNTLTVNLTLGSRGPTIPSSALFSDKRLSPPAPGFPLPNNTIDDVVIEAIVAGDPSGAMPFSIPQIGNFQGGGYVVLRTEQQPLLGYAILKELGSQIWPLLVKVPVNSGAFDFTGPMAIFYAVYTANGLPQGMSQKLNLQIRRKQFSSPSPVDTSLPRPQVKPATYAKENLITDDLIVSIPMLHDLGVSTFAAGDLLTVNVTLTGYTADNENQIRRLLPQVLTLSPAQIFDSSVSVTFPRTQLANIDGSFGSVFYTRTPAGSSSTVTSPSQIIVIDTVEAFSGASAYHIDKLSTLVSHL